MHRYKTFLQAIVMLVGSFTFVANVSAQEHSVLLTIQNPLPGERFVAHETVNFKVELRGRHIDPAQITWTSSVSGVLGHGIELQSSKLPPGIHEIKVSVNGETQSVSIREFKDLLDLYQAAPSQAELDRIRKDFSIEWVNGSGPDENWATYDPPIFNQASLLPAKVVVLANLDILRHQVFSEPLPFGDGLKIYDHVRKYVNLINLRLDCDSSAGGGGKLFLNRGQSTWGLETRDCKSTIRTSSQAAGYANSLALLIHEARHSEPDDRHHTSCYEFGNMDASLDQGSGHAAAALYSMWVYKYGVYDAPIMKQAAKEFAYTTLSRLCSKPLSSNPKIQALVNEILDENKTDNSPATSPLPAPALLSPGEGATLNDIEKGTTLRWNAVPQAAGYLVEWDYGSGQPIRWFSETAIDSPSWQPKEKAGWWFDLHKFRRIRVFTTEPSFTFHFVGLQPGRWRVWAVDANDNAGARSKWREFRYVRVKGPGD